MSSSHILRLLCTTCCTLWFENLHSFLHFLSGAARPCLHHDLSRIVYRRRAQLRRGPNDRYIATRSMAHSDSPWQLTPLSAWTMLLLSLHEWEQKRKRFESPFGDYLKSWLSLVAMHCCSTHVHLLRHSYAMHTIIASRLLRLARAIARSFISAALATHPTVHEAQ